MFLPGSYDAILPVILSVEYPVKAYWTYSFLLTIYYLSILWIIKKI